MNIIKAKEHLHPKTEYKCRYVKSSTENFTKHTHDYFELFLVIKGKGKHTVGDTTQIILPSALLFIRDFDEHKYTRIPGESFEFINLSFSKNTFEAMFRFFDNKTLKNVLLNAKMPPMVMVSEREKEKLFYAMSELLDNEEIQNAKIKCRTLLAKIFTEYFINYSEEQSGIPLWLEMSYEKMLKPINFIKGPERMVELSGKTREHLSRSMKKYYKQTVSEFVNGLKLNHSANLLLSSDFSIIDICFECGFENLSWFYRKFEEKFGCTPKVYRKQHENQKNTVKF